MGQNNKGKLAWGNPLRNEEHFPLEKKEQNAGKSGNLAFFLPPRQLGKGGPRGCAPSSRIVGRPRPSSAPEGERELGPGVPLPQDDLLLLPHPLLLLLPQPLLLLLDLHLLLDHLQPLLGLLRRDENKKTSLVTCVGMRSECLYFTAS